MEEQQNRVDAQSEQPPIHAICVVQNEVDVIGESIRWADRFCDRITIWDLGSQDGTYELLKELASPRIDLTQRADVPYSKGVRGQMLEHVRPELPEGGWLYVLDADEFVVGNPKPLLARAARAGAHIVRAWHMNFYPTPGDVIRIEEMGAEDWEQQPLFERLRWFQAEWKERRFLRITDDFVWGERDGRSKMELRSGGKPRVHRRAAMIRHYRYRGPTQVAKRFGTRQAIRDVGYGGFAYDQTARLEDYVRPKSACRRWPDGGGAPAISAREVLRFETWRLRAKLGKALNRLR